jgi:AraC-like DNA-binding protein/mannose-6-phosphate isomerase-like protein (cupin superfamily)
MPLARFSPVTSGDLIRDADSFEPFRDTQAIPGADLNEVMNATTIEAVSASEWRWRRDWKVGPRVIHDSMWFYVAQGSGFHCIGNHEQRTHFGPGSLLLIPPDVEHTIVQDKDAESHVFAVHFHARIYGAIDMLTLLGFPPVIAGDLNSIYAQASHRLVREFALKSPGWRVAMNADLLSVLFSLVRSEAARLQPDVTISALAEVPRFLPVFRQIERRLHDPSYSVLEMANEAHLSEVQFRKIFRRITGISPLRFVQRRRIERACNLLHTSTDSISSIAEASGFCEPPFFHRVFKTWTGTTPRAYRRAERP